VKLLILILNKVEKLEEVLEGFIEIGITGATVIESVGMGQILSEEVPIFSAIKDEKEKSVIKLLQKILGDLNDPGTGIVFTIPIERIEGLMSEL